LFSLCIWQCLLPHTCKMHWSIEGQESLKVVVTVNQQPTSASLWMLAGHGTFFHWVLLSLSYSVRFRGMATLPGHQVTQELYSRKNCYIYIYIYISGKKKRYEYCQLEKLPNFKKILITLKYLLQCNWLMHTRNTNSLLWHVHIHITKLTMKRRSRKSIIIQVKGHGHLLCDN
jgi:hypothetical protein